MKQVVVHSSVEQYKSLAENYAQHFPALYATVRTKSLVLLLLAALNKPGYDTMHDMGELTTVTELCMHIQCAVWVLLFF